MKEATGELNATVVVFLAVGVLIAFFYYTLWPIIRENFVKSSACSSAVCDNATKDERGYVTCYLKGKPHTDENKIQCSYKG